ncbi:MAG: enoyl-CoA hydratase/isomerase family protein [Acidimicrobiales bacterium]|nr:enoyl-CoA hydratase/isomerase family protein [Acidimicrobiales bacterium]|tara:strand:- start:560 stop:1396 length:837 start_codon:yes stop_codon:yes gene_type:complete
MDEKSESDIEKSIKFQVENNVAWITIDNQKKGNGLTPDMRDHLIDLFESFNGQFEVRSAVITGAGEKFFCTGADLSASRQNNDRSEGTPSSITGEIRRMMLDGSIKLMNSVLDCEIPVIASVNGTAAGIGAHLAFCSDLVVTADTARFIEIFARRGLVPDGLGAWILPRLIGIQKTKELMFFADDVSAEEALRLGLCNRSVPASELETKSREWAERLASGPSRSYMFTKWMLNKSLDVDRITLAEYEAWAVEVNASTHDSKEGVVAFQEKRNPEWKGY